jgi:hypothetical protein
VTVSFSSQVLEFNTEAKENTALILRDAVAKLHKEIARPKSSGGSLPFDTGNLGRSIEVSTVAFPEVDRELREYTAPDVSFMINSIDYGDPVYIGVRAVYGPRMNYGFVGEDSLGRNYNQAGNYFVERGGNMWPGLVREAEALHGE